MMRMAGLLSLSAAQSIQTHILVSISRGPNGYEPETISVTALSEYQIEYGLNSLPAYMHAALGFTFNNTRID